MSRNNFDDDTELITSIPFHKTDTRDVRLADSLTIKELQEIGKKLDISAFKGILMSMLNDSLMTGRGIANNAKLLDILSRVVVEEYKVQQQDELNKTIAELLKSNEDE